MNKLQSSKKNSKIVKAKEIKGEQKIKIGANENVPPVIETVTEILTMGAGVITTQIIESVTELKARLKLAKEKEKADEKEAEQMNEARAAKNREIIEECMGRFNIKDPKSFINLIKDSYKDLVFGSGGRRNIDDSVRAGVEMDLEADLMTARQIAEKWKVSAPTVNNWKKQMGKVKVRVKKEVLVSA